MLVLHASGFDCWSFRGSGGDRPEIFLFMEACFWAWGLSHVRELEAKCPVGSHGA